MKKIFAAAFMLFPAVAMAHVGDHSLLNWKAGFLHPLTGLDHLLALIAAGVWLAQSESRSKWVFIVGFTGLLAIALVVGTQFTHLGFESGIVATLIILGALMACAVRGPLILRSLVIGAVAAIHGFVHGTELLSGEGVLPFALALVVSSLMVLAIAVTVGMRSEKFARGMVARIAGVLLILFGFGITL